MKLSLLGAENEKLEVRMLDDTHSSEEVAFCGAMGELVLKPYMIVLLETPGMYTKRVEREVSPKIFAGQDEQGAKSRKAK